MENISRFGKRIWHIGTETGSLLLFLAIFVIPTIVVILQVLAFCCHVLGFVLGLLLGLFGLSS